MTAATFVLSFLIHAALVSGIFRLFLMVENLGRIALIAAAALCAVILATIKAKRWGTYSEGAFIAGAAAASIVTTAILLWLLWALSHPVGTPAGIADYLAGIFRDRSGISIILLPVAVITGAYVGLRLRDRRARGHARAR